MNIFQNTEDKLLKHSCNIRGKQILTKKKLKQVHKNKGLKCKECDQRVKQAGAEL